MAWYVFQCIGLFYFLGFCECLLIFKVYSNCFVDIVVYGYLLFFGNVMYEVFLFFWYGIVVLVQVFVGIISYFIVYGFSIVVFFYSCQDCQVRGLVIVIMAQFGVVVINQEVRLALVIGKVCCFVGSRKCIISIIFMVQFDRCDIIVNLGFVFVVYFLVRVEVFFVLGQCLIIVVFFLQLCGIVVGIVFLVCCFQ